MRQPSLVEKLWVVKKISRDEISELIVKTAQKKDEKIVKDILYGNAFKGFFVSIKSKNPLENELSKADAANAILSKTKVEEFQKIPRFYRHRM